MGALNKSVVDPFELCSIRTLFPVRRDLGEGGMWDNGAAQLVGQVIDLNSERSLYLLENRRSEFQQSVKTSGGRENFVRR